MTHIGVRRWNTTYRACAPLPAAQIDAWAKALANVDIRDEVAIPDEAWICIRRVTLTSRWAADCDAFTALHAWQEGLAAGVREALRAAPSAAIVRYRDRRDAIVDMLYRAAAGDASRAWAWRRMALLAASSGESRAADILAEAARTLAGMPEAIWPAIARIILAEASTGAFTAVMHALPAHAWQALLAACPQTRVFVDAPHKVGPSAPERVEMRSAGPIAHALCQWISQHSWTAREHPKLLAVLLACATARPSDTVNAHAAAQRLAAAMAMSARHAQEQTSAARPMHARPCSIEDANAGAPDERDAHQPPSVRTLPTGASDACEAPPLPDEDFLVDTEWAGLAFLINVASACRVLHERKDAPVQQVLHRAAVAHFGVPAEEAGLRALCGGYMPDVGDHPARHDDDATRAAHALCDALRARIPELAQESNVSLAAIVCRRPGRIRFEPGWIDIHMDARQADVRLRRAALDFDPGFVPWLGCVVRFHYE